MVYKTVKLNAFNASSFRLFWHPAGLVTAVCYPSMAHVYFTARDVSKSLFKVKSSKTKFYELTPAGNFWDIAISISKV